MGGTNGSEARARSRELRAEAAALRARSQALHAQGEQAAARLVQTVCRASYTGMWEPGETLALHLGRIPASVPLARHKLQTWLHRRGVEPDVVRDVTLACSEACANAVEHPRRPRRQAFHLQATCTNGEIEVTVRDYGGWQPPAAERTAERGRGLTVIQALMDATEIERGAGGTTVVMRRGRSSR